MKTQFTLNARRYRRAVFAQFMILAILVSIFSMPSVNRDRVYAQTACRSASSLPVSQIARAFATRIGANLWQIRFEIRQQHAMFCDPEVFAICNRDKFAKKDDLNVNVVNATAGGVCNEFHQFNNTSSQFEYAVKIRYQENFFNGFPNGNPKRKVAKIVFNTSITPQSLGEEIEVTDSFVDLPDDGSDN
jgi:hypothetical protein